MKHDINQLVECLWPYLGKIIFWNLSIVTVLILALIKLLRVLWCPKQRRLSRRKFLSGGNTWKTIVIQVFKIKPKSCMVAIATYMKADWWNWALWTNYLQCFLNWWCCRSAKRLRTFMFFNAHFVSEKTLVFQSYFNP